MIRTYWAPDAAPRRRGVARGVLALCGTTLCGVALLGPVLLAACAAPRAPMPGARARSILLVTFEGLRGDAVGLLGGDPRLTPALDTLGREAAWAGTAIAPSSDPRSALASLMTGLRPWQHQAFAASRSRLPATIPTLASRLAQRGYRTTAYLSGQTVRRLEGADRGFEAVHRFGDGSTAVEHLRQLGSEPELVWVHLRLPAAPYVRREAVPARVLPTAPDLPARIRARDLERFFDPAVALGDTERERLRTLYLQNVAAADFALGRLLGALAHADPASETLVATLGVHGQEFGEHGQVAQGGNLGRASIEVPLFLRLPAALSPPPGARDSRPESRRLIATLLELVTGEMPPPGLGASLFAVTGAGAVSELYGVGGLTEISLLDGDLQLRRRVRFAQDGDYFAGRRALAGWPEPPDTAPPGQIFPPLAEAFENLPVWTGGGGRTRNLLYRWTDHGAEPLLDPALASRMEARLAVLWDCFTIGNRRPRLALERLETHGAVALE